MAYALNVDVIDAGDGTIKVTHTFWGLTEKEAREYLREHQGHCEYFAAAMRTGRTIEELEKIDDEELPAVEDDDEEEDE